MPELPEVETIRRGITDAITDKQCQKVIIRYPTLRWAIPKSQLKKSLTGSHVNHITRRSKYLLFATENGTLIIHLGMSGVLRLHTTLPAPEKHDHADFIFNDVSLRYTDPRRFGAILWTDKDPNQHPLLKDLGPEPLTAGFNPSYLQQQLKKRKSGIKTCIMNSKIVVGVGNIYATEALFKSGIHPERPANAVNEDELNQLCHAIKTTLRKAIKAGGTTLKDFKTSDGKPGYFKQELNVYGRENQACVFCNSTLKKLVIGQRTTVYCPNCQN